MVLDMSERLAEVRAMPKFMVLDMPERLAEVRAMPKFICMICLKDWQR
jgi:hypothetical protein